MKLISSTELNKTPIFQRDFRPTRIDPDGFEIKRAIVQHGGSAVMMPVWTHRNGRILLVRRYRLPARQYLWELPAGRVDEGGKAAAGRPPSQELVGGNRLAREKVEKDRQNFITSPGFLAEKMTIFLATGSTEKGQAKPMEDERIEIRWFSRRELGDWIKAGKIRDAKTIIGFCRYRD